MSKDNGSDIGWSAAADFCRDLRVGGYKDWTRPTIDELEKLNQAEEIDDGRGVKGLKLTKDYAWSSVPNGPGEAWVFKFHPGKRYSQAIDDTGSRALCVRRNGN